MAPGTDALPMKDVETVLMEVADIVNSTVADDKAREEIFRRVGRIFRSPRENLTPKRRKRRRTSIAERRTR